MSTRIDLGASVKCKVTGFTGIVVSRHEYLNGCWRYGIQPKVDKDGKVPDVTFIDEQQLETTAKPKAAVTEGRRATGGDRPNPRARQAPR